MFALSTCIFWLLSLLVFVLLLWLLLKMDVTDLLSWFWFFGNDFFLKYFFLPTKFIHNSISFFTFISHTHSLTRTVSQSNQIWFLFSLFFHFLINTLKFVKIYLNWENRKKLTFVTTIELMTSNDKTEKLCKIIS